MENYLSSDEKILWKSFPGKRYRTFIFSRDLSIFIFLAFFFYQILISSFDNIDESLVLKMSIGIGVLGLLFSVCHQISFLFIRYYISNEKVSIKRGFISYNVFDVKLRDVVNTSVKRTVSDRFLKTGSLYIQDANDEKRKDALCFANIDDPHVIHQKLHNAIDNNSKNQN